MSGENVPPVLSPEQHQHFVEHGYIVLEGVVPQELLDAAIDVLANTDYEGSPGAGDYKPVRDEAIDACLTEKLTSAVEELAGGPCPPISPPQDRPRPYEPNKQWENHGPHVDQNEPSPAPTFYDVGMFIFLTTVRAHGGAFQYAHGSPRRERSLISRYPSEWLVTANLDPEKVGHVDEFLAEPGDAIIFQHLMVHCGSDNVTDPRCRRALEARFALPEPIRPGDKPFDEMSTLEKANSPTYLATAFGDDIVLPQVGEGPDEDAGLAQGFAGDGGLLAAAATREDGWTSLYYADAAEPSTLKRIRSRDWVTWEEAHPHTPTIDGRILSIQCEHRRGPTLTIATDAGTVVFTSNDYQEWTTVTAVDRLRLSRPRFVLLDMAATTARSDVAFYVDPEEPTAVHYRFRTDERQPWASSMAGFADWPHEGIAIELEEHGEIESVLVQQTIDLSRYALLADVDRGDGPRAEAAVSGVTDEFKKLQPLTANTPTPPRQVRMFECGKGVWLATYLRDVDGEHRAFWATVNWRQEQPSLRTLDRGEDLRAGLHDVCLL